MSDAGNLTAGTYNKLTLTQPASGATLTLADGSTLALAGAYSTTLTATATTNATLPAGTHSLAPLDSPTFTGDVTLSTGNIMGGPTLGLLANLYYAGGWKYVGNGYGSQWVANNSTGGVQLNVAPLNSSGAGAAASPVTAFSVTGAGGVSIPLLATSGGTVKGTLCQDTTGVIYVKTTSGACIP
ncbi:hypothetical protein [Methylosinus sporium]|uniref:hypothetical protein n=1 Tax=Methylosinus sporium TaxID=428 RepID=UPI00383A98FB